MRADLNPSEQFEPEDSEPQQVDTEFVESVIAELRLITEGEGALQELQETVNELNTWEIGPCLKSIRHFLAEPGLIPSHELVRALLFVALDFSETEVDLPETNKLLQVAEKFAETLGEKDLQAQALFALADNFDQMNLPYDTVAAAKKGLRLMREHCGGFRDGRALQCVAPLTLVLSRESELGANRGNPTETVDELRGILELFPTSCHRDLLQANAACIEAYSGLRKFDVCEALFQLASIQSGFAEQDASTDLGDIHQAYGDCLLEQGRASEAQPILKAAMSFLKPRPQDRSPSDLFLDAACSLVDCLRQLGKFGEASEIEQHWGLEA